MSVSFKAALLDLRQLLIFANPLKTILKKLFISCYKLFSFLRYLNCNDVVLEIYLDHKFQLPQEGWKCESLSYKVIT